MRRNKIITKGTACLLSAALLMSLAPTIPDMGIKSYAAEGVAAEPSVEVYADVDTLTETDNNIFTPKYVGDDFDSDNTKIGKLLFGKGGTQGEPDYVQEWYILGPDENIDGKNIAIFAAYNFTSAFFHKDGSPHSYEGDADENYVTEGEQPTGNVESNHYGESDIRTALRNMSGEGGEDTYKYFTATEKNMMQKTKVLTREYSNDHLYTINDKLYLATTDWLNDNVYVGSTSKSGDSYVLDDEYTSIKLGKLAAEQYWGSGVFWLRRPNPNRGSTGIYADPDSGTVKGVNVYNTGEFPDGFGVRPASNLDMSTVLFAAAADAQSSEEDENGDQLDTNNVAMILRLNGSDKNIGAFTYDASGVIVKKGSIEGDVFLVVQGKTSDDIDWYYSQKIATDKTVSVDTIAAKAGIDVSAIDLTSDNCKIWLETPVSDAAKLYYAVDKSIHTHIWSEEWTPYGSQHGHACTDPKCPDKGTEEGFEPGSLEEHTYGADNVCTKCGYKKGEHIVTYVAEKPATGTTVGYKEHFECSHCAGWFIYPATAGLLIEEPKSYFEIPATGNGSSSRNSERYSGGGSSGGGGGGGGTSSSTGTSIIGANGTSGSWVKDNTGWRYKYAGGTYATGSNMNNADGKAVEKISWVKINNADYAFGADSYLKSGWVLDNSDGKWYYCDVNRGRLYGWYYDTTDGYWYYLDANTGAMLTGWQLIGGKQYYFAPAPAAATYTFDAVNAKWVYSNAANNRPYGSMYAGTTTPDNYQVDANGARVN